MPKFFQVRCGCGQKFNTTREWSDHRKEVKRDLRDFLIEGAEAREKLANHTYQAGEVWREGPNDQRFYKSNYWGTWSRVLEEGFDFIDVALTAINPNIEHGWKEIGDIKILCHHTERKGEIVKVLPPEVYAQMETRLGKQKTSVLLYDNFLTGVNWDRFHRIKETHLGQVITVADFPQLLNVNDR